MIAATGRHRHPDHERCQAMKTNGERCTLKLSAHSKTMCGIHFHGALHPKRARRRPARD